MKKKEKNLDNITNGTANQNNIIGRTSEMNNKNESINNITGGTKAMNSIDNKEADNNITTEEAEKENIKKAEEVRANLKETTMDKLREMAEKMKRKDIFKLKKETGVTPNYAYKEPYLEALIDKAVKTIIDEESDEKDDNNAEKNPFAKDIGGNKNFQSNMFQITINNDDEKGYTDEHVEYIFTKNFKTVQYFCHCREIGSCHHMHIFVVFTSRVRWQTVKKHFKDAHIEVCYGSVSENVDYIRKSGKWKHSKAKQDTVIEGSFVEWGVRPPDSKGKRVDLAILHGLIEQGYTTAQIIAINKDYMLYHQTINKVRTELLTEKYKDTLRLDMEVYYIFGPTNAGKTRYVLENNNLSDTYRITDYKFPYDNYACENVLFYDEFRDSIPLSEMLLTLDIYPLHLRARYVPKVACYNKAYIASNWRLEEQYINEQVNDPESWKAFLRRITKVIEFTDVGEYITYDSVEEYFNRDK